jgi:tRNA(Ile2) C34 agmatinyltransferase TiaS
MYIEMRLRSFVCPDCSRIFKSTSPNAIRCTGCATAWDKKRKREYQKRRRAAAKARQIPQRPESRF